MAGINTNTPQVKIIRFSEATKIIGLSKSSIYNRLNKKHKSFDPAFPNRVYLGPKAVGFMEHEIISWLKSKRL